ncbi:hypothetical protein WT46_27570 [Burkholderia stagnalis]|nr:hypothetical protein WT46_27570 [Burkholderia stagnalis]
MLLAIELCGERSPVFFRLGEILGHAVVVGMSSELKNFESGRIVGFRLFVFLLQLVHLMALNSDAMAGAQ